MKRKITTLQLLSLLIFQSAGVFAQSFVDHVSYNKDGSVSMVTFKKGISKNTVLGKSENTTELNKLLQLSDQSELKMLKEETFQGNFVTEKYQNYYAGYKIEGGEFRFNYRNGALLSITGKSFDSENVNIPVTPISESQALDEAMKEVNAQKYVWQATTGLDKKKYDPPKAELVLLPMMMENGQQSLVLAYKFDIYALQPLSRDYIYVDAGTGLILKRDAIIKHIHSSDGRTSEHGKSKKIVISDAGRAPLATGTAATRYSGERSIFTTQQEDGSYILQSIEDTDGVEIWTGNLNNLTDTSNLTEFTDLDNNWTAEEFHNTAKDDAALDAHWGVVETYQYFKDTFGRNSYDNEGSPLYSFVHYSNNYENASWTGSAMVYGDGASTLDALTSVDITAHELGHAVCGATANLSYQRESGALNEGFSDIWGSVVEHYSAPEKDAFSVGEDVMKVSPYYLRSMSNPKSAGQPDTYRGQKWVAATSEEGCVSPNRDINDYCGVHTNSGVLNHWFYILVSGKSGTNDKGDAYDVTGIGWEKAAQIVYRLETSYLTSSSDYQNARDYAIQAAKDLFLPDSPEAIATQDAFYAVGVGGKYLAEADVQAPTAPLNLKAENTTGDATTLSWEASTDENGVAGYYIYQNGQELVKTSNLTYRITGLSKETTYTFTVKAYDNYSNISEQSNGVEVTTTSQPKLCGAGAYTGSYIRIKNVAVGDIDNPSTSTAGYEDFSYMSTDLNAGETYTLTIKPNSAAYSAGYAVYIDWNNNGSLSNSEKVASISPTKKTTVTADITVPETAVKDTMLKVRIIQSYGATPTTACGLVNYGQVEDYSVVVKDVLATDETSKNKVFIYPNPAKDILHVSLKSGKTFDYSIFNTAGNLVKKGVSSDEVNVQALIEGVYFIQVNFDGEKTIQKFIKK